MKTSVSLDNPDAQVGYANWIRMVIEMIAPKDLYLIAGRGTAKTTSIQANRFIDISHDMNHAWFAWGVTTYMDAMDNIVPVLIEGLKLSGWREGRHFVTDEPPPSHFKKPYKAPKSYKHTISTFLGTFTQIVSMDQVTSAAGGSFQHLYGDELKNIKEDKIKKLWPALRGGDYQMFGRSPYYRGKTFTTDMPNLTEGEHDYILNWEKEMNVEQCKKIIEIFLVLNDIRIDYMKAYQMKDQMKLQRARRQLIKWKTVWYRARRDSTLFLVASAFANIDILTLGFFQDVLKSEGVNSFRTTIMSMKPVVKRGDRFYTNLVEHHFFDDGVRADFYDRFNLNQRIVPTSEALRYCKTDQKLEAGVDFGDMCSMVTAQTRDNYVYLLKNFFTLAPEEAPHLAAKFREFYRNHPTRVLDLYYDRSGNQNKKTNRDWASALKHHIENNPDGTKTGWMVNMMSLNQANIYQSEEYRFMKVLLGETVKGLPKVRIDRFQNRELKSSLELTKTKISKNRRTGSNEIGKDKSSESLPLDRRPMYSTNFSDAFKYLLCRHPWMVLSGYREATYVG